MLSPSRFCPCCGAPVERTELVVDDNMLHFRGSSVPLWPQVANLAELLVARMGRMVSHEAIYAALWRGPGGPPLTAAKAVQVYVCVLRKAVRPLGLDVETIYKRGYKMVTT